MDKQDVTPFTAGNNPEPILGRCGIINNILVSLNVVPHNANTVMTLG